MPERFTICGVSLGALAMAGCFAQPAPLPEPPKLPRPTQEAEPFDNRAGRRAAAAKARKGR